MDSKTPTKTINFICMIKPKTIKKNFDKRAKKKKSNVGGPNWKTPYIQIRIKWLNCKQIKL